MVAAAGRRANMAVAAAVQAACSRRLAQARTTVPSLCLTDIDPGNHTIQIDTSDTNGQALSLALGLTISPGLLPTTGTNTNTNWLVLLTALGALITLAASGNRRRQPR